MNSNFNNATSNESCDSLPFRRAILRTAENIVCKDRNDQYGEPEDNFGTVARFWSGYLGTVIKPEDVANLMILFKVARNKHAGKPDNWIDIAGYAACGGEVAKRFAEDNIKAASYGGKDN